MTTDVSLKQPQNNDELLKQLARSWGALAGLTALTKLPLRHEQAATGDLFLELDASGSDYRLRLTCVNDQGKEDTLNTNWLPQQPWSCAALLRAQDELLKDVRQQIAQRLSLSCLRVNLTMLDRALGPDAIDTPPGLPQLTARAHALLKVWFANVKRSSVSLSGEPALDALVTEPIRPVDLLYVKLQPESSLMVHGTAERDEYCVRDIRLDCLSYNEQAVLLRRAIVNVLKLAGNKQEN